MSSSKEEKPKDLETIVTTDNDTIDDIKDTDIKDTDIKDELKKEKETKVENETKEIGELIPKESSQEPVTDIKEPKPTKDSIGLQVYSPEPITKDSPPPPKPKRPLTPRQEAFKILSEAFPTFDEKLINTVLIASGFKLEPSFNALLFYTDPSSFNIEEIPVEEPSSHVQQESNNENLLKQDELLAKQLDEEFKRKERRRAQRQRQQQEDYPQQQRSSNNPNYLDDDEDEDVFTNFVQKDLPELKEQFNKNLQETRTKFSNWFNNLNRPQQNQQHQYGDNSYNQNRFNPNQKSNLSSFDNDPEELDLSKFHGIKLNDDTTHNTNINDEKPKLPNRSRAESLDLYGTPKSGNKKWEPLNQGSSNNLGSATTAVTTNTTVDDDDDFLLSDEDKK
ncbi:hypothetical protein WICMUC_004685 [Wickerhamomyces mucosus]|uniref:CUE domain-containing protein n=1 Tax=Wickerhamomyces mucosus TaxID=1378264 RepID=A0A9P8T9I0_9ASCO|nr:hypothetical protein WICMUC_004685 [Wickerhamomyces mucosus]